jgi:hypothetical protein
MEYRNQEVAVSDKKNEQKSSPKRQRKRRPKRDQLRDHDGDGTDEKTAAKPVAKDSGISGSSDAHSSIVHSPLQDEDKVSAVINRRYDIVQTL